MHSNLFSVNIIGEMVFVAYDFENYCKNPLLVSTFVFQVAASPTIRQLAREYRDSNSETNDKLFTIVYHSTPT